MICLARWRLIVATTTRRNHAPLLSGCTIQRCHGGPLDAEDYLIAKCERFALCSMLYHPAVMRAFKDFRREDTRHRGVHEIHKITEEYLIFMEKRIHKPRMKYYFPLEIEKKRRWVGNSASLVVSKIKTDKELMTVAACLAILGPRSVDVWLTLDKEISERAREFSVDAVVLCAHTILQAIEALGTRKSHFLTPQAAASMIADNCTKNGSFPSSSTHAQVDDLIFAPVGSSRVEHSASVELLGLCLHVLQAAYRYTQLHPPSPGSPKHGLHTVSTAIAGAINNNDNVTTLETPETHRPTANNKHSTTTTATSTPTQSITTTTTVGDTKKTAKNKSTHPLDSNPAPPFSHSNHCAEEKISTKKTLESISMYCQRTMAEAVGGDSGRYTHTHSLFPSNTYSPNLLSYPLLSSSLPGKPSTVYHPVNPHPTHTKTHTSHLIPSPLTTPIR